VQRDHRPYAVKKTYLRLQNFYSRHFLRPQFTSLGKRPLFIKPWHVEVFGAPVALGNYATVIAAPDARVRLAVWPPDKEPAGIRIGSYALICPGVRIGCARQIRIADNCMIASHVYITDSDWHGLYNRVSVGTAAPVRIDANVWVGDSAIICKGVHVGANSIIGAGAVVTGHVPADSVVAGNPAKVVKTLDSRVPFTTRKHWYADPDRLFQEIDRLDRQALSGNSLRHWLRHLLFPSRGD
jgi:acetyltransferase-like isoleucine patch superfamily enzyme